ncbi:MAG: TIGR02452 family protein [Caldilineaceae bacterium]
MNPRTQRAAIAVETVEILNRGVYAVNGAQITLVPALEAMRRGTVLYTPSDLTALLETLDPPAPTATAIHVANCTTLAAAKSLIDSGFANPLCLNFASAKNAGGGFLTGAQAQEEYLARASGLYAALTQKMDYYQSNRACGTALYTNHIIYAPSVPVFRHDDDALMAAPYSVSIVTAPAVNAGAVRKNEQENIARIRPCMEERIRSVLAVARQCGHRALVLGAWGCGVFGNDPADVAQWFADALLADARFAGAFARVIFAVLDFGEGAPTFQAFQSVFAPNSSRNGGDEL